MADEPFRLACGLCLFKADTPEQYIDHILSTRHAPDELLAELKDGNGYAAFARELATIQQYGAAGQVPPNTKPISLDDVPDSVRENFERLERQEIEEYAASLTTAELIERLRKIADWMERMQALRPVEKAHKIIAPIRAAEIRLRQLGMVKREVIAAFIDEVNAHAERDIDGGRPIEGAHHRALEALRQRYAL